jgi:UDP-3-O-[3-hydroxymyristoyl] glucosamine N-acyltransferase
MGITASELAVKIGGECEGDGNVIIHSIAGIREAVEGQVTFIADSNSKYVADIKSTRASAIIAPKDIDILSFMSNGNGNNGHRAVIRADLPKLAMIKAQTLLAPKEKIAVSTNNGIHPLAFLGKDVTIGKGVHIGPFACVEDGSHIGDDTIIYPNAYIGSHCRIGAHCQVYPNVTIREDIQIGNRVIIHSGTVIGGDGFGYEAVNGEHYKVPQLGTVVIEDDVEIGANVTIDRATFGKTWIKKGTKIDNLVQIGHNVIIGENCIIVAQTGIAGSTELEDRVTLAAQVGVTGHIKIGSDTIVTGRSAVTKSIPSNACVTGHPAKPHKEDQKIMANVQRLPKLAKRVQELEQKLEELSQHLNNHPPSTDDK